MIKVTIERIQKTGNKRIQIQEIDNWYVRESDLSWLLHKPLITSKCKYAILNDAKEKYRGIF